MLAEDLEEVVQHLRVVEALDEHEEGDGGDAAVQRVVEADLAEELEQQQCVAQPEALVLGEGEEEVEVAVVVAVERRLLDGLGVGVGVGVGVRVRVRARGRGRVGVRVRAAPRTSRGRRR